MKAVLLGILVAGLAENATAGSKVQGNLHVTTACATGGGCIVDSASASKVIISRTNATGSNGVRVKFKISGASKLGALVTASNVRVFVGLDPGTGCVAHSSTSAFNLVNGKLTVELGGGDFTPAIPESPDAVLHPCGNVAHAQVGSFMLMKIGTQLGSDPD
jgi:hypothetical protein